MDKLLTMVEDEYSQEWLKLRALPQKEYQRIVLSFRVVELVCDFLITDTPSAFDELRIDIKNAIYCTRTLKL